MTDLTIDDAEFTLDLPTIYNPTEEVANISDDGPVSDYSDEEYEDGDRPDEDGADVAKNTPPANSTGSDQIITPDQSVYARNPDLTDAEVATRIKFALMYFKGGEAYEAFLSGSGMTPESFRNYAARQKDEAARVTEEAKKSLGRDVDITASSADEARAIIDQISNLQNKLSVRGIAIDGDNGTMREYGSLVKHVYIDGSRLSTKQLVWWQKTGKLVPDSHLKKINQMDGLAAVNLRYANPAAYYKNVRFSSAAEREEFLIKRRAAERAKRDNERIERMTHQVMNRVAAYAYMSVDELKYAIKITKVRVNPLDGEIDLLRYIVELRNGWERYSPDVINSINAIIDGKYQDVYTMILEKTWDTMEREYLSTIFPSPFRHYFELNANAKGKAKGKAKGNKY